MCERDEEKKPQNNLLHVSKLNISKSMLLHSVVNHYNVLFDFSICLSFILFSSPISSCLVCSFLSELQKISRIECGVRRVERKKNIFSSDGICATVWISWKFHMIPMSHRVEICGNWFVTVQSLFIQLKKVSIKNRVRVEFEILIKITAIGWRTRMLLLCYSSALVWFIINSISEEKVEWTRLYFHIHQISQTRQVKSEEK